MATLADAGTVNSADPAVPTVTSASAGDLLALIGIERSGATSVTTPSGFTKDGDNYESSGDATYRRAMAVFSKIAAGGETSASIDFSSTGTIKGRMLRFAPGASETISHLATVLSDDGTSNGNTGFTALSVGSQTFDDAIIVGWWYGKTSGASNTHSGVAFTGPAGDNILESFEINGRSLVVGYGFTSTDGTISTDMSWTNSNGTLNTHMVGLSVYKITTGGGGGVMQPQILQAKRRKFKPILVR